ncbi:MAG: CoA transferase [Acidimicrobiales bacterium]|nr:CaiB/BaiF CoA-transferase family protein [Acidimicrobiaceae bacterium]MDE0319507.1 CaiB/BaiF CoA-transferase family protein [Acidimicrobiaceae bacterium]MXZ14502.1 CoA transferase [Acidimicrobiales bacterium]MYG60820.1 CoA transferase [Acidimicrobiales bacterium]MYJ48633.1 CoA transferase [Acidimicrobiales bacterium]
MTASANRRPLAGIRVFEISIAVAAPCCGKAMAHHGAEVFKVEAHSYPDVARAFGSAWARDPELADVFCDTGPYVPEMSAGKRSVGLELKQPQALEAAKRLLATCDVFLTNFAAPGIAELGLDYESVKQVCPDIIYAGMTGFGVDPDKPYYPFRAFGPNQAPLVGWDALTGFPHEEPAGIPSIAPPDYMGGLHTMLAIVTALHERDRTGEGRFIDISQLETTVSFLGPYLVGQDLGVPEPFRNGNRVSWAAPAGIYPCAGNDRWIAVEVPDDEAWQALAGLAEWSDVPAHDAGGGAALSTYPHGTLADRVANHDAIDAELSAWTSRRSPQQAAAELQELGVAAYEVLNHTGVLADPQVHDRRPYSIAPSPRLGRDLFVRNPVRLSATPPYVTRAGPNMGGDTVDVLTEIGYSEDDVEQMVSDGTAFVDARPEVVLERPFDRWYESVGIAEFYDAEGSITGGSQ